MGRSNIHPNTAVPRGKCARLGVLWLHGTESNPPKKKWGVQLFLTLQMAITFFVPMQWCEPTNKSLCILNRNKKYPDWSYCPESYLWRHHTPGTPELGGTRLTNTWDWFLQCGSMKNLQGVNWLTDKQGQQRQKTVSLSFLWKPRFSSSMLGFWHYWTVLTLRL